MAKLFNLVATLSVATLLAAGGFAAYLVGTGQLNAERAELMAAALRGDLDGYDRDPNDPNAAAAMADPNALDGADESSEEVTRASAAEARERRRRESLESLRLERARADLDARREMLEQVMAHVVQEQERVEEAHQAFQKKQKEHQEVLQDEGFRKELAYVSGLKPGVAKEYIVRIWNREQADAIRLFMELDQRQGRKILEQFKTPQELEIMTDLLEQIRLQGN